MKLWRSESRYNQYCGNTIHKPHTHTSRYHKLFVWHQSCGFYSFSQDITPNHVCTRIPPNGESRECIEAAREGLRTAPRLNRSERAGRGGSHNWQRKRGDEERLCLVRCSFFILIKSPNTKKKEGRRRTRKEYRGSRSMKWCLPPP